MSSTNARTGWVACDGGDDRLSRVTHEPIRATEDEARKDWQRNERDYVRYVGSDGYLYVDADQAPGGAS